MAGNISDLTRLIRTYSAPSTPVPPTLPPEISSLVGKPLPRTPAAALFDLYGTLFTSASGDISTTVHNAGTRAVRSAFSATGTVVSDDIAGTAAARFRREIEDEHRKRRAEGIDYPEIEVRDIWRRVLNALGYPGAARQADVFAITYEADSNPVWPMPQLAETLSLLRGRVRLGIVSNAQFYTPLLFPALLGSSVDELGFQPTLVTYSYEQGRAKPSPALFDGPLAALAELGIDSTQVVYIGNDMLNDVATAASRRCMTILYAGDVLSLRLRRDEPAVARITPDSVAVCLEQVAATILDAKEEP